MTELKVNTVSFGKLYDMSEVFSDIASIYHSSLRTGIDPVIGVLQIDAILKDIPPIEKLDVPVAGAYIASIKFKTWENPKKYLEKYRYAAETSLGKRLPESFYNNILGLYGNAGQLLSLITLMFFEGQMQVFSDSLGSTQETALSLLEFVAKNKDTSLYLTSKKLGFFDTANAHIRIVMYAGKKPYIMTLHTEKTINTWMNELDAATVILFPQIALSTLASISEENRIFFTNALENEIRTWKNSKPRMGALSEWEWLPELM